MKDILSKKTVRVFMVILGAVFVLGIQGCAKNRAKMKRVNKNQGDKVVQDHQPTTPVPPNVQPNTPGVTPAPTPNTPVVIVEDDTSKKDKDIEVVTVGTTNNDPKVNSPSVPPVAKAPDKDPLFPLAPPEEWDDDAALRNSGPLGGPTTLATDGTEKLSTTDPSSPAFVYPLSDPVPSFIKSVDEVTAPNDCHTKAAGTNEVKFVYKDSYAGGFLIFPSLEETTFSYLISKNDEFRAISHEEAVYKNNSVVDGRVLRLPRDGYEDRQESINLDIVNSDACRLDLTGKCIFFNGNEFSLVWVEATPDTLEGQGVCRKTLKSEYIEFDEKDPIGHCEADCDNIDSNLRTLMKIAKEHKETHIIYSQAENDDEITELLNNKK